MSRPLQILFITSELSPLISTGGLAEVAAALPPALRKQGHDIRVALPYYRQVPSDYRNAQPVRCTAVLGKGEVCGALHISTTPGTDTPLYLVEHEEYFGRDAMYGVGAYEYDDNAERFCFYCLALFDGLARIGWKPDVIHGNDWHSAPAAIYLKTKYRTDPFWRDVPFLFSIHNLAYQGRYASTHFGATGFEGNLFSPKYLEYEGDMNLMKGGLVFADKISTVSPRYAREIQTIEYGSGLHAVLHARRGDLSGILNGVDYGIWSPSSDPHIAARYDRKDLTGKTRCKQALQDMFELSRSEAPLFGIVSRLYPGKGMDLFSDTLDELMRHEMQVAILGTGDSAIEARIRAAIHSYPGRIGAYLGFDAHRAHTVYAGSDFFLMPSRFEPCGLGQMYAMSYGTLPLVRHTGGLVDTVIPFRPYGNNRTTATGFSFTPQTPQAFSRCLSSALDVYRDKALLKRLRENAMSQDYSWERSSKAYIAIYESLLNGETLHG